MTSGTVTRDRTTLVSDDYGSTGYIGSYFQRIWSGGDAPRSQKGQIPFTFEYVKVREAVPPRTVTITSYKKTPYWGSDGRLRYRRVRTAVVVKTRGKPAKYEKRRRYIPVPAVQGPRRRLPDHPYTLSVTKRDAGFGQRIQTDQVAIFEYDPATQGYTRFAGYRYVAVTKKVFAPSSSQPFVPLSWTSNDQIALIGKLREKIAGSDFNFGVFLAEAHESLQTIVSAATRLAKSIGHLKKGNFRKAAFALLPSGGVKKTDSLGGKARGGSRSLSSQWLELQYGWLPLLKDIEGAAQFVAWLQSAPIQQSYRAGKKKTSGRVANPVWKSTGTKTETSQVIARVQTIDVIALSGLKDPLSVIWEKTPWSFVGDWVLPVGNFLQARALASALSAVYVETRSTRTTDYGASYRSPDGVWPRVEYTQGPYAAEDYSMTRTVSGSLDVPLPTVKSVGEAASWKRATNAIALMVQAFTRR